ncbi:dual specificity protein phosphatase 7 [Lingula anatina]|uniref:Dual specificity protein phosphatase n=1 Tax=Lingula anatina TaxID=7574 RepID=A0A1S3IT30_LINAN|nr:dual specificity protein phosphatase 7 [Lingula anatina]|eukprot:XP_013401357.1 dual specificity protein phosphatase 7 [Lingula anatina]
MPSLDIDNANMSATDYCTPEWLGRRLNSEEGALVLDLRAQNDFIQSHVEGAINLFIPTLMLRRLKSGNLSVSSVIQCNEGKEKFNKKCKTHTIVLYDDNTKDLNANPTSIINLLVKKLKVDGCQVRVLQGGFQSFEELYPDLCEGVDDNETSTIMGLRNLSLSDRDNVNCTREISGLDTPFHNALPVEVIPNLYLGNARNSADLEALKKHGIQYILNVTPNLPNMWEKDEHIVYKQIPINDHWSQNLSVYFPEAISFIDEAREKGCGVLVHCLAGVSRSVTVTVAYLMQRCHLSLNDAYDYVKKCKPNISPNFNFMGQLLDFERHLSTSPDWCKCDSDIACSCHQYKRYFDSPRPSPNYNSVNVEAVAS